MSDAAFNQRAAREAVQPSLWDRLKNDLPGLQAESANLRGTLEKAIGPERLARLMTGGLRVLEAEDDLPTDTRRDILRLTAIEDRRARIEARGIVVSPSVLREAVRRDIEALFNTERLEADYLMTDLEAETLALTPSDLSDFPNVRRSVVNYGVPAFSGRSARSFDRDALARELREVLAFYEPRLKKDSIRVSVRTGDKVGLRIDIDALLTMSPAPERLRLRTLIDLDNGRARTALEDI